MSNLSIKLCFVLILVWWAATEIGWPKNVYAEDHLLIQDSLRDRPSGPLMPVVGPTTEYHFLSGAVAPGVWTVSTFTSRSASQRAWRVIHDDAGDGLIQTYHNRDRHWHPLVCAGDQLWQDYSMAVQLTVDPNAGRSGVAVRLLNDRNYLFVGLDDGQAVIMRVQNEVAFRVPGEDVLAAKPFPSRQDESISIRVTVSGNKIIADVGGQSLTASDTTFPSGKVGLLADVPATFRDIMVSCSQDESARIEAAAGKRESRRRVAARAMPAAKLWKSIETRDFGADRNLRFADLDGDGQLEIVIAQIQHHGPTDSNSEVSCITAIDLAGKVLWQIGSQDRYRHHLTNDVGFQVHDFDGDGACEVIYCRDMRIVIADGRTGDEIRSAPTPENPNTKFPANRFPNILGDSLTLADLRGQGRSNDLLIKDRYGHVWAMTDQFEPLWSIECNTGHFPFPVDLDADGKDELAIGYSLIDSDGAVLWSRDDTFNDHADAIAVVDLNGDGKRTVLWAGSDEGLIVLDDQGLPRRHLRVGHAQNITVANLRDDLPGLEVAVMNFWKNQGILHLLDSNTDVIGVYEPRPEHGSAITPVNWIGNGVEHLFINPSPEHGGLYDGNGQCVLKLPADGHPTLAYDSIDLTGDARDELVVWDSYELWIYTQAGPPPAGDVFVPRRNPRDNESNYRARISR
ncbi:hypothetical protein NHH03_10125 [Stieleria sp. TO1_6]|uniref:rhamnogalacturonan lyase family protein n=1 Tax=Stieleria tagensis TaxID=2956795 RepID=UPI00209B4546|nr:hypothetical protein [Stieleria tagensis]MCO8122095.1 hypothetical protein [Stieleria tagensis]